MNMSGSGQEHTAWPVLVYQKFELLFNNSIVIIFINYECGLSEIKIIEPNLMMGQPDQAMSDPFLQAQEISPVLTKPITQPVQPEDKVEGYK